MTTVSPTIRDIDEAVEALAELYATYAAQVDETEARIYARRIGSLIFGVWDSYLADLLDDIADAREQQIRYNVGAITWREVEPDLTGIDRDGEARGILAARFGDNIVAFIEYATRRAQVEAVATP